MFPEFPGVIESNCCCE